ncbi:MAG: methylated-DNA--[protein]-cysteine S-methyltransferase [Anaeromicrobium sp.]|jgi:methylated-DNA-[protein]-cysteine S-methyltransferase|uniref:methylated-DNA--[protein]-cysteine S-methyltransferase n=1 Tax=Anaeromicrobium sp. TaxID=1929132 RepID=UPI0025D581A4|nr:methylated-DNA--[protein]-cysteine S-methyltransferase [Anaeromicrobium sp.]MCT4596212.1 methylated-DNA--[protein]-cysteine S-methyltransferase [Anaeromicrobium sp.]
MIKKHYGYYESELGTIEIITSDDSVLSITFVEERKEEKEKPEILKQALAQIKEYFEGKRKEFNLKIDFVGTDFQKKVWNELLNISYGQTVSYKHIAVKIGNEKAVRAVGTTNGKNKISIVVPCHRVIGSNGKLTGYAGGVHRKEWLINHENKNSN